MISEEEVKHIAKLARLGLTDKEIGKMQKELSSILDYIDKLKEVDTSKVEPIFHSVVLENVMRKDESQKQPTDIKNKLIEAAPERKERHIKVKTVLGKE